MEAAKKLLGVEIRVFVNVSDAEAAARVAKTFSLAAMAVQAMGVGDGCFEAALLYGSTDKQAVAEPAMHGSKLN